MPNAPRFRIASIAFALSLLGAEATQPGDARGADGAPVLIVTGRVTDPQGLPIPKARVVAGEPSPATASADADGRYTLTLPLADAASLALRPYALTLRAEAKGWSIGLPGGDASLGLELRTVTGLDGTSRCLARSNDVRVAAAAARAVASGREPAAVTVNFTGEKGEGPRGANPELTQTAQVALSQIALRSSPPDSATAAASPALEAPPARASAPSPAPAPETAPASASTPSPAPRDKGQARAEAKRLAREAKEREKEQRELRSREVTLARIAAEAARDAEKATTAGDEERAGEEAKHLRRAAQAQAKAAQDLEERRAADERKAKRAAADSAERAASRAAKAAVAAARETKAREAAARALAARVSAPKQAPSSEPAPPAEPSRIEAPSARPAPDAAEPAVPADRDAPRQVVIHPRPEGEGRARSAPLVIRSGSRAAPAARAAADSCECRIEGTVEVQSNEPLGSRAPVVVSLAWFPAVADTVELFMGSPRAFKLPVAPCGPQRLRVTFPARDRFDVISREAVAGFRCDGGPVRQVRIVLSPR